MPERPLVTVRNLLFQRIAAKATATASAPEVGGAVALVAPEVGLAVAEPLACGRNWPCGSRGPLAVSGIRLGW